MGRLRRFLTTRWSLILAAQQSKPKSGVLDTICELYWGPVYTFVRSQGHGESDAQDLTQAFFASFLEKNAVRVADPERGRFRSFLLASVKHFLSHQRERAIAQKRGGAVPHVSIDASNSNLFLKERLAAGDTPEQIFERRWILQLMDVALEHIELEYRERKRGRQFAVLVQFLVNPTEADYQEAARELHISRDTARVAVLRLRRRFGELLLQVMEGPYPPPGPSPRRSAGAAAAQIAPEARNEILYLKGIFAR